MSEARRTLTLGFHGKIIDHLGIQMYQSPTAAIAEIISNAWDADAENVEITFDFESGDRDDWTISIKDDGNGMTFEECQHRYLSVGYNRREQHGPREKSPEKMRPVMGRKGIGKFAGFGIARYIKVITVSRETTELSEFELDLQRIRTGESYASSDPLEIGVNAYQSSQQNRSHGTEIVLRGLSINNRISESRFAGSLARRFSLNSTADQFEVRLNGDIISEDIDQARIEMSFPRDLPEQDKTSRGIKIEQDGWGEELISGDDRYKVKWRVNFYRDLINDDEIAGITIFAHSKLAQRPFMFNLTGGMASQAGPEYMSGRVVADWVDELSEDVISTERQRLNWEHPEVSNLQDWGQQLIRRLLSIWKSRRTEAKMLQLESKVSSFSQRIQALGSEGRTVKNALIKLAGMEKLNEVQFIDMGNAILLAWEGGRLRELIRDIANSPNLDETGFLAILAEANAITALHTAETVNAKLSAIEGLEQRIRDKELENAVRNFIATNPWLISPKWETFAVENRLRTICEQAAEEALNDEAFNRRVDLVLSSGRQLLLLEFMRPGLTLDRDHLNRFNQYIDIIKEHLETNTALGLDDISGYLVADNLNRRAGMGAAIRQMQNNQRYALTWDSLLSQAKHQWKEFLEHVKLRAPDDRRVQAINVNLNRDQNNENSGDGEAQ